MQFKTEIKHSVLLITVFVVLGVLAFSLEGSEINNISQVKISGNKYLSSDHYLKYSQLENEEKYSELTISLIRDRIEKHPYIENIDAVLEERGIVSVKIFEKRMDAVLLNGAEQFLITDNAEVIPLISSTNNIDLPVIVNNSMERKLSVFDNACLNDRVYCALKIITTAEIYDHNLYKNLSEINLNNKNGISLLLTNIASPIYFGVGHEVEKTVFLSKIFRQLNGSDLSNYLNYVDLRYNELVYLGFDKQFTTEKGKI